MSKFSNIPKSQKEYKSTTSREIQPESERLPYLDKIRELLGNCFFPKNYPARLNCKFKNTRFHYIDVRQKYTSYSPIRFDTHIFSLFISKRIEEFFGLLYITIESEESNMDDLYIEQLKFAFKNDFMILEILIRNFYLLLDEEEVEIEIEINEEGMEVLVKTWNKVNRAFRYFELCLTSNNFIEDTEDLFKDMFSELEQLDPTKNILNEVKESLIYTNIITTSGNLVFHRIRAQLMKLENISETDLIYNIIGYYKYKILPDYLSDYYKKILKVYTDIIKTKRVENMNLLDNIIENMDNFAGNSKLFY